VLSVAEQGNLTTALAARKNFLLIGENINWLTWDNSILAFAGSASFVGTSDATVTPVVSHELTAGIESLALFAAGLAGGGTGGTALFSENFATLWGADLLTVLDLNVFDDIRGNARWRQNVAAFLGASQSAVVLEPATLALLGIGIAGVTLAGRRKQCRQLLW
jgi:hypothetical protein